jgi:hypothetical protein
MLLWRPKLHTVSHSINNDWSELHELEVNAQLKGFWQHQISYSKQSDMREQCFARGLAEEVDITACKGMQTAQIMSVCTSDPY